MKFSVIIPLYNKAPYVAKAIASVLSQTYTEFELLIMDDGSKDNSFEMAQKAIQGHLQCKLYKQDNAGVSMARNKAVALSQGDYLCFLDADDWWAPNYLMEMSKLIAHFPDAGIYGTNYTIVNENRHKTRVAQVGVEDGFEMGYINYCRAYAKTMYMPLWTGAVCIPRAVFEEMKGFPKGIRLGEDFLLWIRIALKYKVAFLNMPLAFYNQDVDAVNRGVGKLHDPQWHMLWNLDFLEEEEKRNLDYKQLIDNLRVVGLYPYFLSREYHDEASKELEKVDWRGQSTKNKNRYFQPILWSRIKYRIGRLGLTIKQSLYKII